MTASSGGAYRHLGRKSGGSESCHGRKVWDYKRVDEKSGHLMDTEVQ